MEKKPLAEFMSEQKMNSGTWKFVILFTIEDIFSLNIPVAIGVTYIMNSGAALRSLGHGIDLTWKKITWLLVIAVVLIVYINRHAPSKINEFTLHQSTHSSTSYLSKSAIEIVLGSFCSQFGEGFFFPVALKINDTTWRQTNHLFSVCLCSLVPSLTFPVLKHQNEIKAGDDGGACSCW